MNSALIQVVWHVGFYWLINETVVVHDWSANVTTSSLSHGCLVVAYSHVVTSLQVVRRFVFCIHMRTCCMCTAISSIINNFKCLQHQIYTQLTRHRKGIYFVNQSWYWV